MKPSLPKILKRPLILGASVSDDYLAPSPGKRLALKYTTASNIKVQAGNGRLGRANVRSLNESALKDRTVILGVDLFFWDSFAIDAAPSLRAIDEIVTLAKTRELPLVIGEIPLMVGPVQRSLAVLNSHLEKAAKTYERLFLLSLNPLFEQIARDGHFEFGGKRHSLEALMPDGLHLGAPASEYLAQEIEQLLLTK